ncbi:MAG: hypothetical protein WCI49_12830 [Ferruginibacter sp.]
MIQINKKIAAVIICSFSVLCTAAQQFQYKAALDSVKQTGFYQLNISPLISSHSKTDFSDIRITDDKGVWIPHIVKNQLPGLQQSLFKEFPILSNIITDSGQSELIFESRGSSIEINKESLKSINEIVLFIKNASVSRYATLSGSNDKKQWFIIEENILLSKAYTTTENYFTNAVKFDYSDYHFFKLVINNEKADPLNIIKAGSYTDLVYRTMPLTVSNPDPVIQQKDSSDGRSYILVKNNAAYHIDGIAIGISGAKFFERTAGIYLLENDSSLNRISYTASANIKISSSGTNQFDIKKIKAGAFYIVIENKDNPPLTISSVRTEQHINNIITYLEKGKQYSLLTDNEMANQPDYDIAIFKDSIPKNADTIGIGSFVKIEHKKLDTVKDTNHKWWLWPSIIGAIIMLAFLSWKLLGDMKKNDA